MQRGNLLQPRSLGWCRRIVLGEEGHWQEHRRHPSHAGDLCHDGSRQRHLVTHEQVGAAVRFHRRQRVLVCLVDHRREDIEHQVPRAVPRIQHTAHQLARVRVVRRHVGPQRMKSKTSALDVGPIRTKRRDSSVMAPALQLERKGHVGMEIAERPPCSEHDSHEPDAVRSYREPRTFV